MEQPEQRYEMLRHVGHGQFGVVKQARDRQTGELVAVKLIERGIKIDRNVERELINHRQLSGHPNLIRFREVFLTPTHLCIAMEYAAGGELFKVVENLRQFSEPEARHFFQQLVCGVAWCHYKSVWHRDLKLENALLDGTDALRLKICDFGYSKSGDWDSQPHSTVGTPAYIAPELLTRLPYDGAQADAWSLGVMLYTVLVGYYPFEDPSDPRNFYKTIPRIRDVVYSYPPGLRLSRECVDLISRIFVANPAQRLSITQIRQHPWFTKDLPPNLADGGFAEALAAPVPVQSVEDIVAVISLARQPLGPQRGFGGGGGGVGGSAADASGEDFVEDDFLLADDDIMEGS